MKLIALGDTHGRTYWKNIVAAQTFDKLIFIGDYFDSKEDIDTELQVVNFLEICQLKREHPEKVVLLLGNHDYHYLENVTERYSDFQEDYYDPINKVLQSALDEGFMQICFAYENILFTHAGITRTWCAENEINMSDLSQSINDLFQSRHEVFGYSAFYPNTEGISPIWVRPNKLLSDKIDNYIQVVGHTRQLHIDTKEDVIFIDTLSYSKEYLKIENDNFSTAEVQ